ncbi:Cys-Gly metallodipeptidase dug1 [Aspergillus nomiae NRRL 13137]|uniref:Cys-Gly metallodipeptidase dug1 n=1 Tax=Aspergillus nomiae NRRL (strain ATCC 15546 / NRRL 13137 / CBS 260.88 / M93) TaxID=1509407 RepID=A0A0L1JIS0_ASPN3|nr:Cys-Gly metallodipeptidase dug1 [Aspergillus nomiae NRRL 13137]KNG91664.1 Cys-Gly metallodipeptidase dug1 [Aspergillus nomiae NRRL 13137]
MASNLDKFFDAVDDLSSSFKDRLGRAIHIQSVSSEADKRDELTKMANFLADELNTLGAQAEPKLLPSNLPPVVIGHYPKSPDQTKPTILIYGHYDVQPVTVQPWHYAPFELTQAGAVGDERYYGRGTTDDKGPVVAWANVIQAHQKAGVDIPVNLRFCFEGMEESGSTGLADYLASEEGRKIFEDVDAGCISDNYWLGTKKPCLTYGLRGINYFKITISGPPTQLHSGLFGGTVYEPLTDLVTLLSKLVDSQGNILVTGIQEDIEPLTEEEEETYDNIDFTMQDFNNSIGPNTDCGIFNNPKRTLMARWRYPSLSIHGFDGSANDPETVTSIPPWVTGKFSIRTVPSMTTEQVTQLNGLDIKMTDSGEWWRTDPQARNFKAAELATQKVWDNVTPDLTREGGSIPVALDIQKGLGSDESLMLLPIGTSSDGAHGPDENMRVQNYQNGVKVLGAYLHYFAEKGIEE